MDKLYDLHQKLINKTSTKIKRYLINEINWSSQLIGITGSKGVGKSTLILQHIKSNYGNSEKILYISMDSLATKPFTIFEIAEHHVNKGGTHLFIDEIHKYGDWSREVKSIYDFYPELHVVFSGSSILQIYTSFADLSRRAITYDLPGLSFREFLNIETGINHQSIDLKTIISDHTTWAETISKDIKVLECFSKYLHHGYYPFYLQGISDYHMKLENVINTILDVDLPFMLEINVHNIFKLKKLLHILASSVPFTPNITKLAGSLELNRATLYNYLKFLDEAKLITLLLDAGKSYSTLSKPEKLYIHNTNLSFTIENNKPNKGTMRETFFLNQLSVKHKLSYSSQADFVVDEKYTFEIGGSGKNYTQIANSPDSYLAIDDVQIGVRNKVPLWLFGFLY
jgi:uncharacterized protein